MDLGADSVTQQISKVKIASKQPEASEVGRPAEQQEFFSNPVLQHAGCPCVKNTKDKTRTLTIIFSKQNKF